MQNKKWGPGLLVTAAFIGPGTVTVASTAGASFGYSLLWAILFAVFATILLQEMAARLGTVTGQDLSVALREDSQNPIVRWSVIALVLGAILVGNVAYQSGNIVGATKGLAVLTGQSAQVWAFVIAAVAVCVLVIGRFSLIQNILVILVAIMSLLFVGAAIVAKPDLGAMAQGLVMPWKTDPQAWITVIGLVGTTVVPYNLFLHSRAAATQWSAAEDKDVALRQMRTDAALSISLGGLITVAIAITAAAAFFQLGNKLTSLEEMAEQLRPVLGPMSEFAFCLGLAAAGLTSAITAPLAAGYVTAGCLKWGDDLSDWRTRSVMVGVVLAGLVSVFIFEKGRSMELIRFAQVANGLLLAPVAVFLLVVMNRKRLGKYRNGLLANSLGVLVVLLAAGWTVNQLYRVALALFGASN